MTTAIYQVNKSNARLKIFIFDGHSNLEDESVLQFYGCNEGVNELGESWDNYDWCRDFKGKAHPVFFIISIVFLIITLFVYLAEDSLRCIKVNKHYCLEGLLSLLRGLLDCTDEPFWAHSKGLTTVANHSTK